MCVQWEQQEIKRGRWVRLLFRSFFQKVLDGLKFTELFFVLGDGAPGRELFFNSFGVFEVVVAGVNFAYDLETDVLEPGRDVRIGFHPLGEVHPKLAVFFLAFNKEFPGFFVFYFGGVFRELFAVFFVLFDAEVKEGVEPFESFFVGESQGGG